MGTGKLSVLKVKHRVSSIQCMQITMTENRRCYTYMCVLFVVSQVTDLVLIDPIPEDIFEEEQWKEYW